MNKLPIELFDTFLYYIEKYKQDFDIKNLRIGQLIFWALNEIDNELSSRIVNSPFDPFYYTNINDNFFIYIFGDDIVTNKKYIDFKEDFLKNKRKYKSEVPDEFVSYRMTFMDFSNDKKEE